MPPTVKAVRIDYTPRKWAEKFHQHFERFSALVLHRRAGKTTAILNHHLRAATDDDWERQRLQFLHPTLTPSQLKELVSPPGGRHYGHVMPLRTQAKAVAWDKLKHYSRPFDKIGGKSNESELLYRYPSGHKVQLFGADDPDAMRGMAFSGLSFDEYSQQPSNIYTEVLSKALGDHLGYAIFAGTIKGKDHLYKYWNAARQGPGSFALWQDVDESLKSETGITIQFLKQAMADDRKLIDAGIMTQEEYDQEWFLSLEAAIKGAYYAERLSKVRKSGRICKVPHDPNFPVNTAWDLGHSDDTAIWFYQNILNDIRVLDCHAESGGTIETWEQGAMRPGSIVKEVWKRRDERGYRYEKHWLPHDAKAKTLGSDGKSIVEKLSTYLGISTLAIVPDLSVIDGIQAGRTALDRSFFDEELCEDGLNALLHYKKKFDNKAEVFSVKPVHDWSSHYADGWRMLSIAEKRDIPAKPPEDRAIVAMRAVAKLIEDEQNVTLDELWARSEEQQAQRRRY